MIKLPEIPYIPGKPISQFIPLERYLPPLSEGIIGTWLHTHLDKGDMVIDPYGSHPWVPIEAARAGYKVLMSCNNPVIRLITELLAYPPDIDEYQTTTSELLTSKRGEQRLEQLLQEIYQTKCPACGKTIQVEGYLWRKDEEEPYAKQINCHNCGETGVWKIDGYDREQLEIISKDPIFRHRAIGRVALEGEEISDLIAEAIKVYLPRQLYFLMTLLNKSESIQFEDREKSVINAMLLHLFDKGNILWNWPVSRTRPKSLVTPSQFREINLWQEIVISHKVWTSNNEPIQITTWPELPVEAGICIFPGRFKDLSDQLGDMEIKGIISAVPRPNQAFWTFSAIWSGWLWGRNAVIPLKSAIERRRYDWRWHTFALHSINLYLRKPLKNHVKYFGIVPEMVPRFFASVIASFNNAGFKLEGVSYCDDEGTAQTTWIPVVQNIKQVHKPLINLCENALSEIFAKANEPLTYNHLHAYFFALLGSNDHFLNCDPQELSAQIDLAEDAIQKNLGNSLNFRRFGSESQNIDSGFFWPRFNIKPVDIPLTDRVEQAIVQLLEQTKKLDMFTTASLISNQFPGIITPSPIVIKACLDSYCSQPITRGEYVINDKELSSQRQEEIQTIQKSIIEIGSKLGFLIQGKQPVQWSNAEGQSVYSFHFTPWANISHFLLYYQDPRVDSGETKLLVLPGSRSLLVSLKLKRDGRTAEIARTWKFLKFRHIRNILDRKGLTRDSFRDLLDMDPISSEGPAQLTMFNLPD